MAAYQGEYPPVEHHRHRPELHLDQGYPYRSLELNRYLEQEVPWLVELRTP